AGLVVQPQALGNVVDGDPMTGSAAGHAHDVLAHGRGRPVGWIRLLVHGPGEMPQRPGGLRGWASTAARPARALRGQSSPAAATGLSCTSLWPEKLRVCGGGRLPPANCCF